MKNYFTKSIGWTLKIMILTILLAALFSMISILLLSDASIYFGMFVVFGFVLLGITSDTIGLSAAAAKEIPFHAMASKKMAGAREAIQICRNAEMFSSFFNDVVGDICGIVSGTATAAVVIKLTFMANSSDDSMYYFILSVVFTSCVAGLTVGGKAICKSLAIRGSTMIILFMGKVFYFIENKLNIRVFGRSEE